MKKNFLFEGMIPVVCAVFLATCTTTTKTDIRQLEGKWNIVEVNGQKLRNEEPPFLEFDMDEMRVHGNTGCNLFNTTLKQPDEKDVSSLVFNSGLTTMRTCPDMETEQAILKAFKMIKAVRAGKTEQEMQLVGADGEVVLRLMR